MVWSSFLGTGVTERNKKCSAFLEFFRQVVVQKFWGEVSVLSLSLKWRMNSLIFLCVRIFSEFSYVWEFFQFIYLF